MTEPTERGQLGTCDSLSWPHSTMGEAYPEHQRTESCSNWRPVPAPATAPSSDVLKPSVSLLVKLGSIAVHAEEILSPKRHQFDVDAINALLSDEEVKQWLAKMSLLAFLPVKR